MPDHARFLAFVFKKKELLPSVGHLSLDTFIYAHIPTILHKKINFKNQNLCGPLKLTYFAGIGFLLVFFSLKVFFYFKYIIISNIEF